MTRSSLALALILLAAPATAQVPVNPDICTVPVAMRADVDPDLPRRMAHEVLMLPGVPQPVIYPFDRSKGVWTIDAQLRLVRFPGATTGMTEPYRFAKDPRDRRIVGIGSQTGVYVLEHGETAFRLIRAVDRALGRPDNIRYSERLDAVMIFDPNGIFRLLRGSDEVVPLRGPAVERLPDGSFDIPALDAKVEQRGREVDVVFDDGVRSNVLTLPPRESVLGVKVGASGEGLLVRTESFEHTVSTQHPQIAWFRYGVGSSAPNALIDTIFKDNGAPLRLHGPGMPLVYDKNGLQGLDPDGRPRALPLPFDPRATPIQSVGELPGSRLMIVITTNNIYALDGSFAATVVAGGDQLGAGARHRGVIPTRNMMLVAGERTLYLLVDRRISGPEACVAP
jgi:hypothetical protein